MFISVNSGWGGLLSCRFHIGERVARSRSNTPNETGGFQWRLSTTVHWSGPSFTKQSPVSHECGLALKLSSIYLDTRARKVSGSARLAVEACSFSGSRSRRRTCLCSGASNRRSIEQFDALGSSHLQNLLCDIGAAILRGHPS
jgi:hypothetical protein